MIARPEGPSRIARLEDLSRIPRLGDLSKISRPGDSSTIPSTVPGTMPGTVSLCIGFSIARRRSHIIQRERKNRCTGEALNWNNSNANNLQLEQ